MSLQPYLLHDFELDFYGEPLRLLVTGYIRPELKFEGESWMEDLKAAIGNDVVVTDEALAMGEFALTDADQAFLRSPIEGAEAEGQAADPAL